MLTGGEAHKNEQFESLSVLLCGGECCPEVVDWVDLECVRVCVCCAWLHHDRRALYVLYDSMPPII